MGFFHNLIVGLGLIGGQLALVHAHRKTELVLNEKIKEQIIRNLVYLLIFFIAIIISYFKIFGKSFSLFLSSLIILGLLIYTSYRFIRYGLPIIPLIFIFLRDLILSKNIIYAITSCVLHKYKPDIYGVRELYHSINSNFFDGVLPYPEEIVEYVWGFLGKRIIIFLVSLGIYILLFTLFVKPTLIYYTTDIRGLKIYFAPFVMAIDYFFKTNLMEYIVK